MKMKNNSHGSNHQNRFKLRWSLTFVKTLSMIKIVVYLIALLDNSFNKVRYIGLIRKKHWTEL